jgi:hypothetical protein
MLARLEMSMRPASHQPVPVGCLRPLDRVVVSFRALAPPVEDAQDKRTGARAGIHFDNLREFASVCIRETRTGEIAFPILIPVVGVTGEDLLRAVKLFEQHPANEQVRPCHRPERHDRVGAIEDRRAEPFGATNSEGKLRPAPITPTCDTIGQSAARPSAAALVESDKWNTRRQRAEDQLSLARFNHHRREPTPLLELDDDGGWDYPAGIKRLELP